MAERTSGVGSAAAIRERMDTAKRAAGYTTVKAHTRKDGVRVAEHKRRIEAGGDGEIRSYSAPWYDNLSANIATRLFGENANARQFQAVRKVVGPENPFNLPAQVTQGVRETTQAVRQGDYTGAAGHAAMTALAAAPLAGAMYRATGPMYRAMPNNAVGMAGGKLVTPTLSARTVRGYHGMSGELQGGRFDPKRSGQNWQDDAGGIFWTTNPAEASRWADNAAYHSSKEAPAVVPADLTLQSPLIVDARYHKRGASDYWYENRDDLRAQAKRGKNDSVLVRGADGDTIVTLRPGTVQSATTGEPLFEPNRRRRSP